MLLGQKDTNIENYVNSYLMLYNERKPIVKAWNYESVTAMEGW